MMLSPQKLLNRTCWFFTCAIMCVLTIPVLIKQGMFNDAVLYTSVSLNLSKGIGSFWFPYFDEWNIIGIPSFHEQPPLVFGIQSLFFYCLDTSIYVERFYTFLCMLTTAFLINQIWKLVTKSLPEYHGMSFLAILLWITIPVCFWSYSNNMHENTMGIFVALSVYLILNALQNEKYQYRYFLIAACCIACAFLCKGFPGLFPIGIPFMYFLCFDKISFKQSVLYTIFILVVLVCIGALLYCYSPAKESLSIYLFQRAFARINDSPSVDSRFFILGRLLSELLPALIVTAIALFLSYKQQLLYQVKTVQKISLFFLVLGCCGSLPLMLTKVQNGFYFVAALPYFGIGLALLIVPLFKQLLENISAKRVQILFVSSIILFMSVLVFSFLQKGKYSRDKLMLQDLEILAKTLPSGTRLCTSPITYENWILNGYLVRLHSMSIANILLDKKERTYFIEDKNSSYIVPDTYQEIELPLQQFRLYKKISL